MLALQPPTGQEALPHSADEEMEAHRSQCPDLGGHLAWAWAGTLVGPRLQWAGGMWSGRPLHTVQSGFRNPIDPILPLNKLWSTGRLTLLRASQRGPGVFQAQLPSLCRLGDPDRAS